MNSLEHGNDYQEKSEQTEKRQDEWNNEKENHMLLLEQRVEATVTTIENKMNTYRTKFD